MATNQFMTIPADVYVNGTLTARTFEPPANSVRDSSVAATAAIAATKLEHQHVLNYNTADGTAVVADTRGIWIVRGLTGTLVNLDAAIVGAIATGGDRTVNIDIQKSTGGGAFATVLTGTIQFTNADVLRTIKSGSFSATSLVADDILKIIITVAGAAGAQAQGLIVTLTVREAAS